MPSRCVMNQRFKNDIVPSENKLNDKTIVNWKRFVIFSCSTLCIWLQYKLAMLLGGNTLNKY